jgi:hypothetical protein
MKYGLGVFRKGIVTNDIHGKKYITQMSGYNILLSHNMWFKVKEIKTKQGFL